MNSALVSFAMIFASVVLPVPGGPQKMSEPVSSRSICDAQRLAGADQMLLAGEFFERARAHAIGQRTVCGRWNGGGIGMASKSPMRNSFHHRGTENTRKSKINKALPSVIRDTSGAEF